MISAAIESIKNAYLARCVSGEKRPTFGLGASAAAKFKAAPSIIFVPVKGTMSRPQKPGAIALRVVEFAVRVSGDDIDDCEDLMAKLVEAMRDALTGYGIELLGEQWNTAGEHADREIVVMGVAMNIELTRREPTDQVVEQAPITATIEEAGVTQAELWD